MRKLIARLPAAKLGAQTAAAHGRRRPARSGSDIQLQAFHGPISSRDRATGACCSAHAQGLRPVRSPGINSPLDCLCPGSEQHAPVTRSGSGARTRLVANRNADGLRVLGGPWSEVKEEPAAPRAAGGGHERKGPPNSRSHAMTFVRRGSGSRRMSAPDRARAFERRSSRHDLTAVGNKTSDPARLDCFGIELAFDCAQGRLAWVA
jgi:hypothetical protein